MAHTPGPWIVGPFGDIWPASDIEVRDGKWRERVPAPRILGNTSGTFVEASEVAANAKLMASAPDLLAALKALIAVHRQQDTTGVMPADKAIAYGQAAAAIAKAEV